MNILKALSKQLFGAKYEGAMKSLVTCLILFTAIHTAEIRMEIAQSILFLTTFALSAGIMWQVLHSSGKEENMTGLFMLALFFVVHEWSALQIIAALFCA